jgi:hypothetical protein
MAEFRPDLDYIREIWPTLSEAERREFYRQYQSEASPARARSDLGTFPAAALDVFLLAPRGVAGAAIDAASALGRVGQSVGKAAGVIPGESEPVNIPNPYRSMTPFYDEVRKSEAKYPLANVPFDKFAASFMPGGRYADQPIPPPPPPAPPVKEEVEEEKPPGGRSGSIPSGAAGMPPSTLFPPLEKFGDPAQRRAQVETALENRMKEIGDYKAPEKSILDSPYAAILQAGLGMLMGGTGKSPLEAIAAGGREGLQSAKEIAQRQEARAEKEYGRKVERVKLKSAIEKEMFDITAKEDDLRAKFQELEILRARGISADQIGRMEAALKAQYQTIQERKLDLMEGRYGTQDRVSRISALQNQNELAQKELKTALDAGDNARATSIRNAIRMRENQINDLQGTQPSSRANPNQAIPPPR